MNLSSCYRVFWWQIVVIRFQDRELLLTSSSSALPPSALWTVTNQNSTRLSKVSAKWAWICLVPRLALLTFDGRRGTRVMAKFQRRKGTEEDPTWRLKQRFPPLLSQSNCFFHQLRIAVLFDPIILLLPSAMYLASLAEPIKLFLPSALYLVSLAEPIKLFILSAVFWRPLLSQ